MGLSIWSAKICEKVLLWYSIHDASLDLDDGSFAKAGLTTRDILYDSRNDNMDRECRPMKLSNGMRDLRRLKDIVS